MTRALNNVLLLPSDELELAVNAEVAGREADWGESVANALEQLELALRQHAAAAEDQDGPYSQIDLTRPTVIRQIQQLRREHGAMIDEVRSLTDVVRRAALAFRPTSGLNWLDHLAGASRTVPDFSAVRERAARFLAWVQRHEEDEDMLLLDSVAMDIGTGD